MTIYYCARVLAFCLMLFIIAMIAYLFLSINKALTGDPGTNGSEVVAYLVGVFFGYVFMTITNNWINKNLKGV